MPTRAELCEELFTHKIACPMGASLEDQAIVDRWQCLRDYCFADELRKGNWAIILKRAARLPIESCNKFICSLTTNPLVTEDSGYSIDENFFDKQIAPITYDETLTSTEDTNFNALVVAYPWLNDDRYSDPGSRHILYNLMISFDDNGESGLDRLQFYHDHHRLTALINLIKEKKLTIDDAEIYDTFRSNQIPPRMLPRLLAGDIDEGITLSKDQIVAYELHDYEPKNNPHRHELLTKEEFRLIHPPASEEIHLFDYDKYTSAHARDNQHIATYFDTVLKPVVAERARLCLDFQRLKVEEQKLSQKPPTCLQRLYYLFYKTPTQECVLVSAKIALFSGALEGMQRGIRFAENKMDDWRVKEKSSNLYGYSNLVDDDTTESYVRGNLTPNTYTIYANANYLKEHFGANAIEGTQFSILNRDYSRLSKSGSILKYFAKHIPDSKPKLCSSVVMLTKDEAKPMYTPHDKGIIKIKINQENSEKVSVYWTGGETLIERTFDSSDFYEAINNLPKPGESSTDVTLCQKISTMCDYSRDERWLTREKPTVNYARDHVATFFKGLIGTIFCIPVGIIGLACPSFANSFNSIFFGTHSFNCLKQAEAARETLAKQMSA